MQKYVFEAILPKIRQIRGAVVRLINPVSKYKLAPISDKFGFDRGTPVDRYYIEAFLEENKSAISGHCLEIHDNAYTKRFGGSAVTQSDAADIDTSNKLANIYVDLAYAEQIPDNTYDTLLITHTIGLIPEHEKAVGHLYRILKPGGKLLLTVSTLGPFITNGNGYWRYSKKSVNFLLEKYFKKEKIKVESLGNVLTGQAFWVGLASEELSKEQLTHNDERFPVIITAVAEK